MAHILTPYITLRIEIKTGRRSVLSFLLSPIGRSMKEAGREMRLLFCLITAIFCWGCSTGENLTYVDAEIIAVSDRHVHLSTEIHTQFIEVQEDGMGLYAIDYSQCPKAMIDHMGDLHDAAMSISVAKSKYFRDVEIVPSGVKLKLGNKMYDLNHGNDYRDFLPFDNGKKVFTWGKQGVVKLWNLDEQADVVWTFTMANVVGMEVSADQASVVTYTGTGLVSLWIIGGTSPQYEFHHIAGVIGAEISKDQNVLVTWSFLGEIKFTDFATGTELQQSIEILSPFHDLHILTHIEVVMIWAGGAEKSFLLVDVSSKPSTEELLNIAQTIQDRTDFVGFDC